MKNITRHIGIVSDIKRLPSSYYGNPRYSFMVDGYRVVTGIDSMHGYGITNYQDKQVTVTVGTHYNRLTLDSIDLSLIQPLNSVEVLFDDPKYNYITSTSPQSNERGCTDYFVGETFNMGQYPKEDYQRCIGINFLGNNGVAA